jgi:hypothetical protein
MKRRGQEEDPGIKFAREMISYTTATVLAARIHVTALMAGISMTDELMERAITAHVPIERDPNGEFRAIVRGIMEDMMTTAEMWRGNARR